MKLIRDLSDDEITNIANEVAIAMPPDVEPGIEMLRIVRECFDAAWIKQQDDAE
jgi:hypothetical protein